MIIIGDCQEKLLELDENSIDTCITDPPYELGFMGKSWDNAGVSFQKETWEKVYRVLKPGGFLLAFGGTRTWHRIAVAIEDAGFQIRDTICWLQGQGFPKNYNISKGMDKKAGKEGEIIGKNPNYRDGRVSDTTYMRGNASVENPNLIAPATPEAELWEGWGTALKPAVEFIVVAMKPIDGTYVDNALKHGVSGLWIDGGRLPTNPKVDDPRLGGKGSWKTDKAAQNVYEGKYAGKDIASSPNGRWPSNVILDETSAEMLDEQTGISKGGFVRNRTDGARPFENNGKDTGYETVAKISEPDGGASRFFYCAKSSKKERNMGLEGIKTHGNQGNRPGSPDTDSGKFPDHDHTEKGGNNHPTVKPLALMQYLVRLTKTPTGGIVLDPFMGSGTTGMACVLENRDFIGIEMDEEYAEIAKLRIEASRKLQPQLKMEI